jgi:hypothetical protein
VFVSSPTDTDTVPDEGFTIIATDDSETVIVAFDVRMNSLLVAQSSGPGGSITIPAETFEKTGVYTVALTAIDATGNTATSGFTVRVDLTPPAITALVASPNPLRIDTPVVISATIDDTAQFTTGVSSADVSVDDGVWQPMTAVDGIYGSSSEHVAVTLPAFPSAGVHRIKIRATDGVDNAAEEGEELLLAVYDPEGGFVTGGGWIVSPTGACTLDPTMMGKATFGFVSKYQKGARVPIGETEFQFKAGGLDFHSGIHDWLVVAGARAQFKGVGTINGKGNYGFMLTAVDGAISGGGGLDKFRIKIWDEATSGVVYDNQMEEADTAEPTMTIGGGSIIIHATK